MTHHTNEQKITGPSHSLIRYGVIALFYIAVTTATDAFFMGDSADYAASVIGGKEFWEFGHLLWRPLGSVGLELFSKLLPAYFPNDIQGALNVFCVFNWLAGLGACLLLGVLLGRFKAKVGVYCVVLGTFLFSEAVLNYVHAATPYPCGITCILLSLVFSLDENSNSPWKSIWAGVFAALAGLFWLNYIFAAPSVLLAPWFLSDSKKSWRPITLAIAACAITTAVLFASVVLKVQHDQGLSAMEWIKSSSHDIPPARSLTRTVFGLARSFVNMGEDGLLFKRFMAKDPYNPVGLSDLLRLSLWKLALFYVFLISVVACLLRHREGRRYAALLAVNAIPVLAFAAFWQGGDMERYLPLYPIFMMTFGFALHSGASRRWLPALTAIFFVTMLASNLPVMFKPALAEQKAASISRFAALRPTLKPHSALFVLDVQDELVQLSRNYAGDPEAADKRLSFLYVIENGAASVSRWQAEFAAGSLSAWRNGGDVWVSKRLLTSNPLRGNWVEGGGNPVAWKEIYGFFSGLDYGHEVGSEDGFVLLKNSAQNRELLQHLSKDKPSK